MADQPLQCVWLIYSNRRKDIRHTERRIRQIDDLLSFHTNERIDTGSVKDPERYYFARSHLPQGWPKHRGYVRWVVFPLARNARPLKWDNSRRNALHAQ